MAKEDSKRTPQRKPYADQVHFFFVDPDDRRTYEGLNDYEILAIKIDEDYKKRAAGRLHRALLEFCKEVVKERGGLNKDVPITAYLRRKYPGFSDEEIKLLENLWRFDRVRYNDFVLQFEDPEPLSEELKAFIRSAYDKWYAPVIEAIRHIDI